MELKDLNGEVKKVFNKLNQLIKENQFALQVGFFQGQKHNPRKHKTKEGGIKAQDKPAKTVGMAQLAYWLEYGTNDGKIPPRPFFRNTVEKRSKEWLDFIVKELKDTNLQIKKSINNLGSKIQGNLQKEIVDLQEPPNAPSTIKQKGRSNPLIDTGEMRDSVKFQKKDFNNDTFKL